MSINILTSMFPNGFTKDFEKQLKRLITKREKFVFVASEFDKNHDTNDYYYSHFLDMFVKIDIHFDNTYLIDSRTSKEVAQRLIETADVIWLSGGDTPTQFNYLKSYGLLPFIKNSSGIIIGMSAGSINMAKTAICTISCGHTEQKIYEGIGVVDIFVEPHFNNSDVSDELLELSKQYSIYGMCDESLIIYENEEPIFLGDIFLIENRTVKQIS
ncbi:Type 1 glutamine amidotransferase-like domain-containing protein [Anaeromicropila herbilytica]|uniref:Dipeptidase E n=1 Tax=Anaeromicropila herbilytica TaxID=2785025 RepID=A0A7R7ICJ9_9FIRM|nr:Type 1 glutamine amidotransferase-like domain-containing protein [Anaeromicropila herbilytica]BCN30828.1 hypothetical protein bsdtb5_21230 [Anaeromicropila herbilytica]